jgi:hypothetical protein
MLFKRFKSGRFIYTLIALAIYFMSIISVRYYRRAG